jgi:small subunit ribosomal protein S20
MNKKQKNRKLILQNKRNKMINRRYTSSIRTISKLFLLTIKKLNLEKLNQLESFNKKELLPILSSFYSIVDKSVKKGVLHQNNANRKKSKLFKLYSKI